MIKFRLLLLSALVVAAPGFATEVYQSTDEKGNPVFSDVPTEGSEAIQIQQPNVGDSVEVPPPSPEPDPAPEPKAEPQPEPQVIVIEDKDDGGEGRHRRYPRYRPHPRPRTR